MENTRVLIATDEKTLKSVLNEMFEKKTDPKPHQNLMKKNYQGSSL